MQRRRQKQQWPEEGKNISHNRFIDATTRVHHNEFVREFSGGWIFEKSIWVIKKAHFSLARCSQFFDRIWIWNCPQEFENRPGFSSSFVTKICRYYYIPRAPYGSTSVSLHCTQQQKFSAASKNNVKRSPSFILFVSVCSKLIFNRKKSVPSKLNIREPAATAAQRHRWQQMNSCKKCYGQRSISNIEI